jgi:hypothetical protein
VEPRNEIGHLRERGRGRGGCGAGVAKANHRGGIPRSELTEERGLVRSRPLQCCPGIVHGPGRLLDSGPATAFFFFGAKIGRGMIHTAHVLDRSMDFFRPLDGRKWRAIIHLGVPQKNSLLNGMVLFLNYIVHICM